MESLDLDVLKTALDWVRKGHRPLLATVARTWGSAPRPVGSLMVLREDGHVRGSVSGGCVEDDLIAKVQAGTLHAETPFTLTYGATAEEAFRFGLPCGGTLQLVLEPLHVGSRIDALLSAIAQYGRVTRTLQMSNGEVGLNPSENGAELVFDGTQLAATFGPGYRLVIIGAAQTSRYVAQFALALGYEVIVCDPREEYLDEWDIDGVTLSREMPDDLIQRIKPDWCTAIVTLSHDPKLDDMALLEALTSPAFYVGAIGSRTNNERRRERLATFELAAAEIERLHGPIGLHIGARTPPEIAVAVMAELTAIRHGVEVRQSHDRRVDLPTLGCQTA